MRTTVKTGGEDPIEKSLEMIINTILEMSNHVKTLEQELSILKTKFNNYEKTIQ